MAVRIEKNIYDNCINMCLDDTYSITYEKLCGETIHDIFNSWKKHTRRIVAYGLTTDIISEIAGNMLAHIEGNIRGERDRILLQDPGYVKKNNEEKVKWL
jgi:hypothetical protein